MSTPRSATSGRCVRGFTLIEILVSMGVIVILIGIVITVGARVFHSQKESQTTGVLRTLDRALEEYLVEVETFPRFSVDLHRDIQGETATDADKQAGYVDAQIVAFSDGEDYPTRPTTAVFIEQVRGFGTIDSIIESMPSQFIKTMTRPEAALEQDGSYVRVADAWDNEIFYVHPGNALAQSLYGRCSNARPYFISAGADGRFGFEAEEPNSPLGDEDLRELVLGFLDDNLASTPTGEPDRSESGFYDQFRAEN